MTNGPISVGVVGLGSFGRHHARHYASHPGAALVAVADVDPARAAEAVTAYKTQAYESHRELIGKVDAVSVCVPASLHEAVTRDLIDAGIHVLVEKPIGTEVGAARDLVAAADSGKLILQVGHIERFSPAVEELRRRATTPRRISCIRRTPWTGRSGDVDVVLDLMIHDIDLVSVLAGAPVASVAASGAELQSGLTDEAEAWLTFTNGVIATLSVSRVASENVRRITVTESDAIFIADLTRPSLTEFDRHRPGAAAVSVMLQPRDNLRAEIDAFLASVATGDRPEVDGRAGLASLEIAARVRTAIAESSQPVRKASDI